MFGRNKSEPAPLAPELASPLSSFVNEFVLNDPEVALALFTLLLAVMVAIAVSRKKGGGFGGMNMSVGLLSIDKSGAQQAKKQGGWPVYTLVKKERLSQDSMRLCFAFPKEKGMAKLGCGRHIMCRAEINEERVVRPYTPTVFVAGSHLELVVKAYDQVRVCRHGLPAAFAGCEGRLPCCAFVLHADVLAYFRRRGLLQAKMSTHLQSLLPGEGCEMFGPVGSLKYTPGSYSRLVLIAAGTGITPVYSMVRAVLADPDDRDTQLVRPPRLRSLSPGIRVQLSGRGGALSAGRPASLICAPVPRALHAR